MKKPFRSVLAQTPWLSLAAPIVLVGSLQTLHYLFPDLFCVAVNPGAKEFICGSDYSHPGIRLLQFSGLLLWVLLVGTGGTEVFRGKATRLAIIAWSVSALLLVGLVGLWFSFPVSDGL